MSYICKKCLKDFKQEYRYNQHIKRKNPCMAENNTLTKQETKQETKQKTKIKNVIDVFRLNENNIIFTIDEDDNKKIKNKKILSIIDKAHNILWQAENIVGLKALKIIMSLLFLKLIQNFLSDKVEEGKIDLLNPKYYTDKFDDIDELNKIFEYFKNFKNLTKQKDKDIRNDANNDAIKQMGEILKRHPITKYIYREANFIDVKQGSTVQTLINSAIDIINFKDFEDNEDIIGDIYEHILTKYIKNNSKELGQFFTPRQLMRLILKFKRQRIKELIKLNKTISIYDSCMATAGWLVCAFNILKNDCTEEYTLAGCEVEPETFQYGLMNLILTIKKFPNDIMCDSSLTHVNSIKHNLILTNPPFNSQKKIKIEQIKSNFLNDIFTTSNKINFDDIFTLAKDDPPIQFLELNIYKLKYGGMCIIVLPYGEFFFGKNYNKTRAHFMKQINITDIITVPAGVFTHTNIKTCVLIFEKNTETKEIMFSYINKECQTITKITTVKAIDIMREPLISWYHQDYLNDTYINDMITKMPNYKWIKFSDMFKLVKGTIASSTVIDVEEEDYDENANIVTFVTGAKNANFKNIIKQDESYLEGENIFISESGNGNKRPVKYFNGPCNYSNLLSVIIPNEMYKDKINKKYIYYYLKMLQPHIESNYQKGSCNQSLDQKNFNRIMIPIPTMEIQNKIVVKLNVRDEIIKRIQVLIEYMKDDDIDYTTIASDVDKTITTNNNKFRDLLEYYK